MPLGFISFKPGIDVEQSPVLNGTGWNDSNRIRFRAGLPEKLGGWTHVNGGQLLIGTGRAIHGWADLSGYSYVAVGTEQRLEVLTNGLLFDITPLRATHNPPVAFSTLSGSRLVTIQDVQHGAAGGDWVDVLVPVSVGGLIIQGLYPVTAVLSADQYQIDVGTVAFLTQTLAGVVPVFTSTIDLEAVTVTFPTAALGAIFTVQVKTVVGGVPLFGDYEVTSITDATHFVITPGPSATTTATVSENSGNARLEYLVSSGLASAIPGSGYGAGTYGSGIYGDANPSTVLLKLRQWFLDNWGEFLIGNYSGGPLAVWTPPVALDNPAQLITGTDVPTAVNGSFVAMPEQILVAWGCTPIGTEQQDPNLVRWSTVGDYTQWLASSSNLAGSFRIPTGSRVVGGLQGPQFACLWTDIDFWLMQFLGNPLVFGFNKLDGGAGLIAARAAAVYENLVFWASGPPAQSDIRQPAQRGGNFFVFDGNSAQVLPCPVWDVFFRNLNWQQADKVICAVNSMFGEIWWFFPALVSSLRFTYPNPGKRVRATYPGYRARAVYPPGGEVNAYVKFSPVEQTWDYGTLVRTCWTDVSAFGNPMGTDNNGFIQQHETGFDDDGNPMNERIRSGFAAISQGDDFMSIARFVPDFIFTGSAPTVDVSLIGINYSPDQAAPLIKGPYTVGPTTPYVTTKGMRGRGVAIDIGDSNLGSFWRLGGFRYLPVPSGKR